MATRAENLALTRRYLKTIESGSTPDELTNFFASDVFLEIFPSRFFPDGRRVNLQVSVLPPNVAKKVMPSSHTKSRIQDYTSVQLRLL